jgi:N-acetylneuraminic acid mutarotase
MKAKLILTLGIVIFQFANLVAQREGDWNTLTPPDAPEARHGHSMVTLPDGRVMLFGGEGPQADLFNDLFVYDSEGWNSVAPSNEPPSPRRDHEAWMEGDNMYVYGGLGQAGPTSDLWSYDIVENKWTEHIMYGTIPPARYGYGAAVTSTGTKLIVGGMDAEGDELRDFYSISSSFECEEKAYAPRVYFKPICHIIDDDLFLVFGKANFIGLYRLSAGMWGETTGGFPISHFDQYTTYGNMIFVFGGKDDNDVETSNVYVFNALTGELTTRYNSLPAYIENGGAAKYYSDTKVPDDYRILIFGGIVDGEVTNTTLMSTNNLLGVGDIDYADFYDLKIKNNSSSDLIEISANKAIQKVLLYDVSGKVIINNTVGKIETSISMVNETAGIYILKIVIDNNLISRKVYY